MGTTAPPADVGGAGGLCPLGLQVELPEPASLRMVNLISECVKRGSENLSVLLYFYFWCYIIRKEFGSTIFTIGLKQGIKETARVPAFDEVTGREAMKTINCAE